MPIFVKSQLEKKLTLLPDVPGIYLYYADGGELIYVGKATSLRSRVRSYFRGARTPRPIEELLHEVSDIKWKETDSVLEAVILESIYIKKYQPKYNVIGKDNKSWNYIVITKDEYPMVETKRQHEMAQLLLLEQKSKYQYIFGPYPGLKTAEVLKLLRKMFQFSTCQKTRKKRGELKPCFYYQIGECLGVCTHEITPADYKKKVIQPLVLFLGGGKKRLLASLGVRMRSSSKRHNFEEAARLRDQIAQLERIHDVSLLNKSFFDHSGEKSTEDGVERIEGYDISNLGSTGKVGSMVVFDMNGPVKSQYRKFTVKNVVGQSDVDCLEEVLRRRLQHDEWPLPSLFLIDGGAPQVNRTKQVFADLGITIPIVGIAKGPERKRNDFFFGTKEKKFMMWVSANQGLLIRVRDEAHRFAITFQRKKRELR